MVQAEDNKKLADTEQQDNERVVYVNSTTKDESGNIVNETDENGKIIQVPVPKGYSASQIDGETTASKGFVIYEGDVDWSTILVGDDKSSSTTNTEAEEVVTDETNEEVQEEVDNKVEENTENVESYDNNEEDAIADDTTTDGTDITDETETTVTQQDINIFNLQKSRNQYVWVPVDDSSRIYGVDSNGKIWGKLYEIKYPYNSRTPLNWTENNGVMSIININNSYREPVLSENLSYKYDTDSYMCSYGIGETRYEMLAQEFEQNYYEIIESIKRYGGFYIGRYETGGLNGKPVVRKMDINITSKTWYTVYKKCLTLKENNDNVNTSMITGSLWDETIEWLVKSGATNSEGKILTYQLVAGKSNAWGNYQDTTFKYIAQKAEVPVITETKELNKSVIVPTGSTEYTKANNIYDMAGNAAEWSMELNSNFSRGFRGNYYYRNDGNAQNRDSTNPSRNDYRRTFNTLCKINRRKLMHCDSRKVHNKNLHKIYKKQKRKKKREK